MTFFPEKNKEEWLMSLFAEFLRGVIGFLFLVLNTLFWAVPVYIIGVFKLITPTKAAGEIFDTILNFLSYQWIYCINGFIGHIKDIEYDVEGLEALMLDEWYLVISNHQTFVDIIVLQKIFHGRIPFLKYFLKKELIWMPVLGLAWWALDYPFMQRYSTELLKKKPHLRGKDIEATRKACAKFKDRPASIMNFVEGTRFTPAKHAAQNSPYEYLLKPRSGGISYVLAVMGENMRKVIDVTIIYPDGAQVLWEFMCNKKSRIIVRIELLPLEQSLRGQDPDDHAYKKRLNVWLNTLWGKKDKKIAQQIKRNR